MAEIRRFPFLRHVRAEASTHLIHYRRGEKTHSGRGLAFWFRPMTSALVEVPADDRELPFLFKGRSSDFQEVTAQGVLTYRVVQPDLLAERVDFSIHLGTGEYVREPLENLALMLTQLAQQHALTYIANAALQDLLTAGIDEIRSRVADGLMASEDLEAMGLEIVSVRIAAVTPSAALEKALETPTRESVQQDADRAAFERRALAVENERAIQENELKNRIELAKRRESLIDQESLNKRRLAEEANARLRLEAQGRADEIAVVQEAEANAERARMEIYRDLPPTVLAGLAARELATHLHTIDHLNVSPELLGPVLSKLITAGTAKLES